MSSTLQSSDDAFLSNPVIEDKTAPELTNDLTSDLFLQHRLRIVEDLWEVVLKEECGQTLVDLLRQLRSIHASEDDPVEGEEIEVLRVIENST